jgi:hypothetical protein
VTLPEIPDEVLEAIRATGYIDVSRSDDLSDWRDSLAGAWPHLYALALNSTADTEWFRLSVIAPILRDMAAEATR